MVGNTLQELGLPHPARNNINRLQREILKETSYNAGDLEHYVTINEPLLVHDQRNVNNIIMNRLNLVQAVYSLLMHQ
jgi:hypothetical protein